METICWFRASRNNGYPALPSPQGGREYGTGAIASADERNPSWPLDHRPNRDNPLQGAGHQLHVDPTSIMCGTASLNDAYALKSVEVVIEQVAGYVELATQGIWCHIAVLEQTDNCQSRGVT